MGTEIEVVDPASVDVDLHDWRKMVVLVARRRTCGHVVVLFCQMRMRGGRRDGEEEMGRLIRRGSTATGGECVGLTDYVQC
jgi:hypothetical protein